MHPNSEGTTSSSPAEQAIEPTSEQVSRKAVVPSRSRKFRAIKTLLLTLVVLAGIGGVLVFSVFLSRPVWHTVLEDGKPSSLVIAIDCPDNWKRIDMSAANARALAAISPGAMQLKRQAPTGLLGWWTRVVLHQDDNAADAAQITAMVFYDSSDNFPGVPAFKKNTARVARGIETLDSMQNGMMGAIKSSPGYQITLQRVQHPLGPALHIAYNIDMTLMPNAARSKMTRKQVADIWYIVPQKETSNSIRFIVISCSSPTAEAQTLKPLYTEVIQRVHLVKKP